MCEQSSTIMIDSLAASYGAANSRIIPATAGA